MKEYLYHVTVPVMERNSADARGRVINALCSMRESYKRAANGPASSPSEQERQHVLDALSDDYLAMAEGTTVRAAGGPPRSSGEPSDAELVVHLLAGMAIRAPHRRPRLEGWRLVFIEGPQHSEASPEWSLQRMRKTANADGGTTLSWQHSHWCGRLPLPRLTDAAREALMEAWRRG